MLARFWAGEVLAARPLAKDSRLVLWTAITMTYPCREVARRSVPSAAFQAAWGWIFRLSPRLR
jgi:hypothetical protein